MRAILPAGLWAVLTVSGIRAVAAQKIDVDSVQVVTRTKLEALLASYGPARDTRWRRSQHNPFAMVGYFDKDLTYASRFEIFITITNKATIWFRVYPMWSDYINIDEARDASGLMRWVLRDSYRSFFFWGVDDDLDVFAGYEFTLEDGFPEEAIKVVIRSVPLIDGSVGEMRYFIE